MPGHLNNEFEIRNLFFLTLQQAGNLLFVPSYSDPATVFKKIVEAQIPGQKTEMRVEMGLSCTQVLLDLQEKEEAKRNRALQRHFDREEAFNKEHQFTEWVHVGNPPNTLVTIEDIEKWYGEDTRKEAQTLFAIRHLDAQKERFVELVKDAMDAGALEVYERNEDFLHCRFRRHDIFHWLGNAGIVDELKREHIIIIPIVDEMIELHGVSEWHLEPTNENPEQSTPTIKLEPAQGQPKKKTEKKPSKLAGRPSPKKEKFIKEIQKRSKQIKFKSDFLEPLKYSKLVYSKPVVTALNQDGEYMDLSMKSEEDYVKHCNGIPRRRIQEQWLPEAFPKKKS